MMHNVLLIPDYSHNALCSKTTKWPYLSREAENNKNKVTFFSRTFKVEEKKVVLFF